MQLKDILRQNLVLVFFFYLSTLVVVGSNLNLECDVGLIFIHSSWLNYTHANPDSPSIIGREYRRVIP